MSISLSGTLGDEPSQGARCPPSPALYLCVFGAWALSLVWFLPLLRQLSALGVDPLSRMNLVSMAMFTAIAWLYGIHNLAILLFAFLYRSSQHPGRCATMSSQAFPPVAILYTTCNDFVEEAAASAVFQDYLSFTVYILDDSNDPDCQFRIDAFAEQHPDVVCVVRRTSRRGYKAGNLNDALRGAASREPLFAIVDADERLPADFLRRSVPILLGKSNCGFVQANHCSRPGAESAFSRVMGIAIDVYWRWYHPLRNRYGLVMLLGHGAVIRRHCWEEVGGFPEIVSEDFAFAVRARLCGWYGYFAEEIICYEDFPSSIRSFRVRHMKWTRGTCEFLVKEAPRLYRSSKVTLTEKLDVLLPVMRLPFSVSSLVYMTMAWQVIPSLLGQWRFLPVYLGASTPPGAGRGAEVLFSFDLYAMTVLMFVSPSLCLIMDLGTQPLRLFKVVCHSAVLYGGIAPLVTVGLFGYLVTGKARFLVTGEPRIDGKQDGASFLDFLKATHPDHVILRSVEILCSLLLFLSAVYFLSLSMLGIACAMALHPILHSTPWVGNPLRILLYLPFTLISTDILLMGHYVVS